MLRKGKRGRIDEPFPGHACTPVWVWCVHGAHCLGRTEWNVGWYLTSSWHVYVVTGKVGLNTQPLQIRIHGGLRLCAKSALTACSQHTDWAVMMAEPEPGEWTPDHAIGVRTYHSEFSPLCIKPPLKVMWGGGFIGLRTEWYKLVINSQYLAINPLLTNASHSPCRWMLVRWQPARQGKTATWP